MKRTMYAIVAFVLLSVQYAASQSVMYVKANGTGKTGSTWSDALPGDSLQYAINTLAAAGGGQVWIAAGIYYPNKDSVGKPTKLPFHCTFTLRANVGVYGGFAGTETALEQRAKSGKNAWEFTHVTTLSGDVDHDGTFKNNAFHVVTDMLSKQSGVVLDGVTITGGAAADATNMKYIHVLGGGIVAKNALIQRCIVTKNFALLSGGGASITNEAVIDSCFFTRDSCLGYGGGVAIIEQGVMKNSQVFSNFGYKAGGVVLHAGGQIYTSQIYNNLSDSVGGVFMNNGGTMVGSLVYNNQANSGAGGIFSRNGTIISCTSAQNIDKDTIGIAGSGYIVNSLFYDIFNPDTTVKTNVIEYNAIDQESWNRLEPENHNVSILLKKNEFLNYPVFDKQTSFLGIAKTPEEYAQYSHKLLKLASVSSLLNAGSPDISSFNLPEKDIYGVDRVKNDRIDIGACEYESRIFISVNGAGDKSGSSWSNASPITEISEILTNQSDEIWFAKGNYEFTDFFTIYSYTRVYGGFAGTEASINERQRADMDSNGTVEPWEFSNETRFINKLQIVDPISKISTPAYLINVCPNSLIDGITFTQNDGIERAGAVNLEKAKLINSKIIDNINSINIGTLRVDRSLVENCYIANNSSATFGGGVAIDSNGVVRNCVIRKNKSEKFGGGVYIKDGTLDHCVVVQNTISGNTNVNGAGVNIVSGLIDHCLIANNQSTGISTRAGGVYAYANNSTVTIRNSTIVHNNVVGYESTAPDIAVKSAVTMYNCIVGSPIYVQSLNLRNNISYSAIVGGFSDIGAGANIINLQPNELDAQFAAPSDTVGYVARNIYNCNWQLSPSSKFANKGNMYAAGFDSTKRDLGGNPYICHDTIDLGAYELRIPQPQQTPIALSQLEQTTKDSVQFSWNNINAEHYTMFVREGMSGAVVPTNGKIYHANKKLGSGSELNGWFCVYDGTKTTAAVTGLMQGSTYKAMLIASNGVNYRVYSPRAVEDDNIVFFTTKREQTIQLDMPDTVKALTQFTVNSATTSGLGVSINSASEATQAIAIKGNTVFANKPTMAIITATQAGNLQFFAAKATDTVYITKAEQSISFDTIVEKTFGDADFRPTVLASSLLDVKLESGNSSIATIVNGAVHIVKPGLVTITATQAGNVLYDSAAKVSRQFLIRKAVPSISFGTIPDKLYGSEDFAIDAKSTSKDAVIVTSSDTKIATVANGIVHINGTGEVTLTASQPETEFYEAAAPKTQSFKIGKAAQTITQTTNISKVIGDADFTLDALSSAKLPITYTCSSKAVSIIDNKVHIVAVGIATIIATQPGNDFVQAATTKEIVLNIAKIAQESQPLAAIAFTFTDSLITPNVRTNKGLQMQLTSSNSSVARIENDTTIHIVGAGEAIIAATQAGTDSIAPFSLPIFTKVTIGKAKQSIVASKIKTLVFGKDTTLSVESSKDLPVVVESKNQSIIAVDGTTLRTRGVGKVAIRFAQAGTAGVTAVERIDTIEVLRANQTILDFEKQIHTLKGVQPLQFNASSSTGFAVKYELLNTSVASCSGNRVTINAPGVCKLRAYVPQSASYNAASDTCVIVVSAMNVLEMAAYTITRDTVIDLNSLRLNTDEFEYSSIATTHDKFRIKIDNSLATIEPIRNVSCWTGVDTLWFKAVNKTTASDSVTFGIKITRKRFADQIGLVTTDSLTGTYNIIAWEPKQKAATDAWVVYRRGESLSQWDSLGQVAATDTAVFADKKVNTKQQAYQYTLVTKDEYGCKSPMSAPHTTMHLKTGVSLQNYPQLWWSAYEGVAVESYIIYRENVQTKKFEEIGSTFLTSFTDQKPNGTNNYRVAIKFANWITPTKLKTDTGPFSQSLSNMSEASLVDITETSIAVGVTAYPNPANDVLTISAAENIESIEFVAADSRVVKRVVSVGTAEAKVSVVGLATGLYSVVVTTAVEVETIRVEVQ